jgi:hypothetical protein
VHKDCEISRVDKSNTVFDSRMILSACKDFAPDIFFYTLQYRALTENSNDIKIPGRLLARLGLEHAVIDCRKPVDKDFGRMYVNNSDIPHLDDWGNMAKGMYDELPRGYLVVKGNGAEIGRNHYPEITSYEYFMKVDREWEGWNNIPFIKNRVSGWYDGIKAIKDNHGYKLPDLFYWEHRMGSWQAQSQLEWDIIQEIYTPFNNRELIDIMLGVVLKYRICPPYPFFNESIKQLWKEVLREPINPKKLKPEEFFKQLLKKAGIFDEIKEVHRKFKYLQAVIIFNTNKPDGRSEVGCQSRSSLYQR